MNRNRVRVIWPLLITMLSAALLTGCPQEWYVSLVDTEDPLSPVFCVSERPGCAGRGVQLSEFIVAAVDDAGKYTGKGGIKEPMWIIEPERNTALNRLSYGRPPPGWREILPSKSLTLDTWYTAGHYYFRFTQVENGIQSEILSDEEFQKRLKLSQGQNSEEQD